MDVQTFINITLVINLVSSIFNVIAYGVGLYQVRRSKVDGELTKIKKNILYQFIVVSLVTMLYAVVFWIIVFLKEYTSLALYLLDFALLLFNIGFNINAVYLARIVESYKQSKSV